MVIVVIEDNFPTEIEIPVPCIVRVRIHQQKHVHLVLFFVDGILDQPPVLI